MAESRSHQRSPSLPAMDELAQIRLRLIFLDEATKPFHQPSQNVVLVRAARIEQLVERQDCLVALGVAGDCFQRDKACQLGVVVCDSLDIQFTHDGFDS